LFIENSGLNKPLFDPNLAADGGTRGQIPLPPASTEGEG
jgi:hypothetical protein